jgi:hypothetical protein
VNSNLEGSSIGLRRRRRGIPTRPEGRLGGSPNPLTHSERGGGINWELDRFFGVIGWMTMRIQVMTWASSLTFVGFLVSACANPTSPSAIRSGAPWARDLNEPPPNRQPASEEVSRIKADLNAARARASH